MSPARLRWPRAAGLAVAMALIMSGCYTHVAKDHQARSPDTRPYYCDAVGTGTPPSGHGNGSHVHPIYEGMTKGPLSWEDCMRLSNQFDSVLGTITGLETRAKGEAAGWRRIAEFLPELGTHHIKDMTPFMPGAQFDPAKPAFLIYGGREPESRLVGVAYYAQNVGPPPEGFAGKNDWWHLHTKACYSLATGEPLFSGEEVTDEECAAMGGANRQLPGQGHWLLHVWIVPPYQTRFDVFVSGHPCMGQTGPLPWEDPCWERYANHEPADGPLPGTEHDAHGGH
jgi:hypothetical protein